MKKFYTSLFFLSFFAFTVQAAVYKWVDEEGNVTKYSDVPQKAGDKPINVPPPAMEFQSNTPSSVPEFKPPTPTTDKTPSNREEASATAYSAVTIMNIQDDQGIRANGGVFSIQLASQPPLNAASGDRYVVLIDGATYQSSDTAEFQLENLIRGTHTISVQIQDQKGSVLTSSNPITMHVLRR